MRFKSIDEIMAMAAAQKSPKTVAVAAAESDHVLEAVMMAREAGFIEPLLIGKKDEIRSILDSIGGSVEPERILEANDPDTCAKLAVGLAKEGAADFLMKGKLNTAERFGLYCTKQRGCPTASW